jgi:flagellum-specific ATP synthase
MNNIYNLPKIRSYFDNLQASIEDNASFYCIGEVVKVEGAKLEVAGISVPIRTLCKILIDSKTMVSAEVVGFSGDYSYLMLSEQADGIKPGSKVIPMVGMRGVKVGMSLLGRVVDGECNPIDNLGELYTDQFYPLLPKPINPLQRRVISQALDVGVRSVNALLTIGQGQRMGIFAASGVGKSVLLGMMTKFTNADVVVVGLIGERGREVKEFIENILGEAGLKRSVLVVAPANSMPLMRANSALVATTIAEYFRDQGLNVLLIVDSLTRYAQACREVSLSAGELPATKGYTPSVFAKLSELVERSGCGSQSQGNITGIYTILTEDDKLTDPVAEHIRSVLDGHVCLSKALADSGHYPAVDVEKSISRVMPFVTNNEHQVYANQLRQLISAYSQNKDMVNMGMYQPGQNKMLDLAIQLKSNIEGFLCQSPNEAVNYEKSLQSLYELVGAQ